MFRENFKNLRTGHFRHTYRSIPFFESAEEERNRNVNSGEKRPKEV